MTKNERESLQRIAGMLDRLAFIVSEAGAADCLSGVVEKIDELLDEEGDA